MKIIRRNGKIVRCEVTPDDEPPGHDDAEIEAEQDGCMPPPEAQDDPSAQPEPKFFTAADRAKYPRRGHIPGSFFGCDGKVVTNPGLGKSAWSPDDE